MYAFHLKGLRQILKIATTVLDRSRTTAHVYAQATAARRRCANQQNAMASALTGLQVGKVRRASHPGERCYCKAARQATNREATRDDPGSNIHNARVIHLASARRVWALNRGPQDAKARARARAGGEEGGGGRRIAEGERTAPSVGSLRSGARRGRTCS